MLVWRSELSGSVEVRLHMVEELVPIGVSDLGSPRDDVVGRRAVELLQVPRLAARAHDGFALCTPIAVDEVLLLATWPTSAENEPTLAVYACVARDPRTRRLVGDGIAFPRSSWTRTR